MTESTRNPFGSQSESDALAGARPVPIHPFPVPRARTGDPQNKPLPPTVVYPPISARRENAPEYLAYLNSPQWRTQRNRALQRAGYRCSRCDSKRRLQVHHLTYARLGSEWDQDLEVLCETCHQNEHFTSPGETGGVYLKLASDAVAADPFGDIADISDAIKAQCVRLGIPPKASRINSAIAVCGLRLKLRPLVRDRRVAPLRALSHEESRELLCRLGVAIGLTPTSIGQSIQTMPALEKTAAEQRAHEERIDQQIQQFKDVPLSWRGEKVSA